MPESGTRLFLYHIKNKQDTSYTRVISWWENNASCLCYCYTHLRQLHKELYLDEKTMRHVYVTVSRIYGRLFLYLMNSKSDATYTRTYLLMRKQCLMFMLFLAASERAEKNPLKIKFRKDIVESYKPVVWAEPRPISMLQNVICRITTYFYLTCSFAVWVCTLELRQP